DDDVVAPFSSRGTKLAKGKPDLAAPGVSIVSAAAPGSLASESARWTQDGYIPGSGTSMSAAVVAGAAAAVLAGNPDLRPNGVKSLLVTTTYRSAALEAADGAGAGGLDLAAALAQAADAPLDVAPDRGPKPTEDWGPAEGDADAWAAFAAAWESGDKDAVRAAWAGLRWQTKQWASRAWMVAVLADSLGLSAKDPHAVGPPDPGPMTSGWHAAGPPDPGPPDPGPPDPGPPDPGPPDPGRTTSGPPAAGPPAAGRPRPGGPARGRRAHGPRRRWPATPPGRRRPGPGPEGASADRGDHDRHLLD
ncbi:MAG: S8 family serine peptidase, partial [Candidatus Nanopelagicales bacterium]|nr:S8 family serine peptidase [Candidatus Nanopelagicales bacterium]